MINLARTSHVHLKNFVRLIFPYVDSLQFVLHSFGKNTCNLDIENNQSENWKRGIALQIDSCNDNDDNVDL